MDDVLQEEDEDFQIVLSNPNGSAIIRISTANITIADKTGPDGGTIQFAKTNLTLYENSGVINVQVDRLNNSSGEVEASYECVDESATAGEDYVCPTNQLIWNDGETASINLHLTIKYDQNPEGPEVFYITLSNPTSGAILGDNDTITITLKAATSTGGDDEGWCFIRTLMAGKE